MLNRCLEEEIDNKLNNKDVGDQWNLGQSTAVLVLMYHLIHFLCFNCSDLTHQVLPRYYIIIQQLKKMIKINKMSDSFQAEQLTHTL